MKKLKVILTVLLTVLIVVAIFATEVLALINISIINPWFYKTALAEVGFYDNLRMILIDDVTTSVNANEYIPEELKEDVIIISERVFNKEDFDNQVGGLIGGIIEYVLYDKGDAEFPFNTWTESFNTEISNSTIVSDIVTSEINSGEFTEDDREYYEEQYTLLLQSIYTKNITIVSSFTGGTNTFSEMIAAYFPTEAIMARLQTTFMQYRIWVKWSKQYMYLGMGLTIVLSALIILLWKKNTGVATKLLGIVLIVNSGFLIIFGGAALMSMTLLDVVNKVPESIAPYMEIVQAMINPIGFMLLGSGILILFGGIVLSVLGGAFIRKKNEETQTETIKESASEISEIDYTSNSIEEESQEDEEEQLEEITDDKEITE